MLPSVIGDIHDFQVLRTIIRSVMVFVVDVLASFQPTTEGAFRNYAMFVLLFSVNHQIHISVCAYSALSTSAAAS